MFYSLKKVFAEVGTKNHQARGGIGLGEILDGFPKIGRQV